MSSSSHERSSHGMRRSTAISWSGYRLLRFAGGIALLTWCSQPAPGAQVNWGSHMGTNVTYVNVMEDSGASEPLPLFGPPTVTGNSIDFNPLGFDASSANGGSDITDSNLVFMVEAK